MIELMINRTYKIISILSQPAVNITGNKIDIWPVELGITFHVHATQLRSQLLRHHQRCTENSDVITRRKTEQVRHDVDVC